MIEGKFARLNHRWEAANDPAVTAVTALKQNFDGITAEMNCRAG